MNICHHLQKKVKQTTDYTDRLGRFTNSLNKVQRFLQSGKIYATDCLKRCKGQAMIDSPSQTKTSIISAITKNQEKIKSFGVKKIGLFGSFVREAQRLDSDVDLLVEFQANQKTFDNFIQLSFFLEDMLNRPVELVTKESLSPYLGPHIIEEVEDVPLIT